MIRKSRHLIYKIYRAISKDILSIIEEFSSILRNRKYLIRYPKLFAIFSIIEHEQNPHLFELRHDDFEKIKSEILHDKVENNHQILEILRGLFQNIHITSVQNDLRDKIIHYLIVEITKLIRDNNRYYAPLTKAILCGFPFLLNYNDYAVFKVILQCKSRNSLKLLKYILDHQNFPNFFIKQEDAAQMLLSAHDFDNKSAFMFLLRYLRQQNLLSILFYEKSHYIRAKIINAISIKKRGVDYSAVLLSYFKDSWFAIDENKKELEKLLHAVFANNADLDEKQKTKNYHEISNAIVVSRSFGYKNFAVEEAFAEIAEKYVARKKAKPGKVKKSLQKNLQDNVVAQDKPSAKIAPRSFFAMAPLSAEERWLIKFASYLL